MANGGNDSKSDASTHESKPDIGSARLRLRADIRSSLQQSAGEAFVMLEDLVQSRFFRMGLREWNFIRLLDGNRTLREAVREYQQSGDMGAVPLSASSRKVTPSELTASPAVTSSSAERLSPDDIMALCNWMLQSGLLQGGKTCAVPKFKGAPSMPWWINPLFIRIPLLNPDRLVTFLLPFLSWTLTPIAVRVWLVVCVFGASQVIVNFERFSHSFTQILSVDNWLYLFFVWLGLKVIHELYHGLICKKHGGNVPRCGLMLIMFSPVAFVDVTSSWRFRSKWQRIYTAAGGIYVEFFVAAIAAIIWSRTEPGILNQVCHNIVTMASIATVLFNCNFLMKFDGYYMLTDLLEIQNLYSKGQQYLRYLVRRYMLNVPASLPRWQKGSSTFIRVYAFASLTWRLAFYVGIVAVAATLFHGAGVVLAVVTGTLWFLFPTIGLVKYLISGAGTEQPNRFRFATIMIGFVMLLVAVWNTPWPVGVNAPGVVQYAPLAMVRVDSEGFVKSIHVVPGQEVTKGDVLVTLDNPTLVQEFQDIELQMQQSETRCRMLQGEDLPAYQVERRNGESLAEQRDELAHKVESLTIRANEHGKIIGRELDSLVGQFVESGETLFAIGNEDVKEVAVSVAQGDFTQFAIQRGTNPFVRIRGQWNPIETGVLAKVDPKASTHLPNPALGAPFGGPLTVTAASPNDAEGSAGNERFHLLSPRFVAKVQLPQSEAKQLKAGQIANVRVGAIGESVGQHFYTKASRWLRRKMEPGAQF
ncbi:MAG: efflux RND transporter periplasmic adaptor subunit [Planctomycetales bacterium]|nr:efflux RND transporter periplasmic adaptor subunit [Planctomycetales bacterium]